jgi:carboxyl-terminal processing protease
MKGSVLFRLPACLFGLALAACGGSGGGNNPDDCSIAAQNQAVYTTMQQWYFWYQELPELDPATFASPEALLESLRFAPLDRFSYLTTQAEEEALFGASQFVGFGFRSIAADGAQIATDVFEGAPADAAGLVRGSRILAVDGVPIGTVLATPGGFAGALGPAEVGYEVTLEFRNPDGEEFVETLSKDVVTIPPVTAVSILDIGGEKTGYLVFRNFVEPGVAALDAAFAEFRAAGVTRLIVDLRYNGGGLISVLEHFANLLGSRIAPGMPFVSYEFNDKNSHRNETFLIRSAPLPDALQLERLVMITTGGTASAAEMLVNGMPPYVTAATVGSKTFGKPVGQFGFQFCEKVLRPVTFRTLNALGVTDFFDGLPADCAAGDTLEVPFGTAGEASFDTAVFWLRHGFCPPVAEESLQPQSVPDEAQERLQWSVNDAL